MKYIKTIKYMKYRNMPANFENLKKNQHLIFFGYVFCIKKNLEEKVTIPYIYDRLFKLNARFRTSLPGPNKACPSPALLP